MTKFLRSFLTRAVTGILFVLVLGAAFIFGPISFAVITLLIITLATLEYCRMLRVGGYDPHVLSALATNVVGFALGFLVFYQGMDPRLMLTIVAFVWIMFLVELFSNNKNPLTNISLTLMTLIYIGLPFALFNLLAFKNEVYDFRPIIGLFLLVWINDTGAYLCGVSMGRHKLYERISPKKTVEGFVGGVLLTIIAGLCFFFLLDDYFFNAGLAFAVVSAVIVGLIGTCGDLIESMFKRSVDIKDSGNLLPGHGGILDRFDAIIFVTPIISLLYYFFI